MNIVLVAVAFASLSAAQTDQTPSGGNEVGSAPAGTQASPSPAPAAQADAPAAERLICRSQPSSESRLSRTRVCRTAAQWRAMPRQSND